jgi:hypothetical protein
MERLASFMLVGLSLAAPLARAQLAAPPVPAQMWLFLAPEEHVCAGPALPLHDPSDPVFFATGPTARLDQHELWAGGLSPMVALRYDGGVLRLAVLGAPVQTRIDLNRFSLRSRWPFC